MTPFEQRPPIPPRVQIVALVRRELVRTLLGRRSLLVWLLLCLPVAIAFLRLLFLPAALRGDVAATGRDFAEMFHAFILRFVVFFGCAGLFMNLFRGEILDRSVHYLLLAPVRRNVLVLGKFLGGLASTVLALGGTTVVTYLLMYAAHGVGPGLGFVLTGAGLGHLAAYLATVVMACVGYGALFLLAGLFFRNPLLPAVALLGWEMLSPFLPPALKALSVSHYLASLVPVPASLGPLAIMVPPVAAWKAVLGLGALAMAAVALAAWRARTLEVSYAAE
jgi:ABC-type transport system involved in multi-copper enzyme maturation permease subunit